MTIRDLITVSRSRSNFHRSTHVRRQKKNIQNLASEPLVRVSNPFVSHAASSPFFFKNISTQACGLSPPLLPSAIRTCCGRLARIQLPNPHTRDTSPSPSSVLGILSLCNRVMRTLLLPLTKSAILYLASSACAPGAKVTLCIYCYAGIHQTTQLADGAHVDKGAIGRRGVWIAGRPSSVGSLPGVKMWKPT